MSSSPSPPRLLPWGRLVLLSRGHRSSLPDHFDLSRSRHCVGRVANRCDLHIPKDFISGLHCIIKVKGKDSRGEPIVEIEDQSSRYGTWVDRVKIGYRRTGTLKKGGVIHLTAPNAKEVKEIAYRLEILPSGLTQQNEELHARMSADEMSVADRTRKRTHEETQCTQSPTKVVLSPPRPRPVKKVRRVTNSQQSNDDDASQPMSEPGSTPATQSAPNSGSQVPSSAAGKRRRRPDVPAPDSKLAELKRKYGTIMLDKELELQNKAEKLEKAEQELESLRKENEAMKKKHEEELAKIKAEAAAEIKKAKAEAAKQDEISKKELSELRQERDQLKRVIHQVLADPKAPHQVRSVVELETKLSVLKRKLQSTQDDLAYGSREGRPLTTPPSKKNLVETERQQQLTAELVALQRKRAEAQQNYSKVVSELTEQESQVTVQIRAAADHALNLSGSSQSQDSVDSGRIRSRRDSQASNEQSEPSPGDQSQTVDEETKSGDTPQGLPPLFNHYGARSAQAGGSRPTTLSQSQFYRSVSGDQERKTEQDDASDETKGN
ncbi:hypothetical protein PHYSODRAFT_560133 [Phytophthora sojae]|uniref:FHA domain-containing protein n=1 Tax=Phytophthora sojae (strain P6497) TaxID=1094619 RepID=G4ZG26_PHYSP|nr:hypothetical protein PHYSODRAFT_560133 [Phytophthora sojae]EGZ17510.1 hypothetical protein PHYSODRAFT_560133 [Phytophthora sojae]|eukprot:XP_009526568.1 hypothetical protein PHYSODRAFT_560133 [Phytophthora sojae]